MTGNKGIVPLIALALFAGGCGGDAKGPGVASTGSPSKRSSSGGGAKKADALAYSRCMRSHGVSNFPDPDSNGRIKLQGGTDKNGHKFGVDPNAPQFRSAQNACKAYEKATEPDDKEKAKMQALNLKYARCMRSHGVANYPDPDPNGGTKIKMGGPGGIDPNTPQFKAAQNACKKYSAEPPAGQQPPDARP